MPMTLVSFDEEMLSYIELVFDCSNKKFPLTNFLGLHGIPPSGGYYWWRIDGKSGNADTEDEARKAIMKGVKK